MLKNIFSQIFLYLMNDRGISKKKMSETLGISPPSVSQLAAGKNLPSLETLIKAADFFGVSLDFLVGRSPLYSSPEGEIKYVFRGEKGISDIYVGKIKYLFGISPFENLETNSLPRQFLLIEEVEGEFLADTIHSKGAFMFLSLVCLLNHEIGFEYDPFHNNNADLIIQADGSYNEISIDIAESVGLHALSFNEEDVTLWLAMPNAERLKKLQHFYTMKSTR